LCPFRPVFKRDDERNTKKLLPFKHP